jgi:hypothetical protein
VPNLGSPEMVQVLPLAKTIQYPANAINADEGQNDGNWQVLVNVLEQSGVPDERLEENIILVHSNLSMKERIDALRKMRTTEHSARNCLNFIVFVPDAFHIKMAATDSFWRMHIEPRTGRDDAGNYSRRDATICVPQPNTHIPPLQLLPVAIAKHEKVKV